MDRWSNFKKMEDEMLAYSNEKLEKYDSSPEDHPKYAEEWKKFWQIRYAEVKDSGMNPDEFDYLQEWIPFWSQRSRELVEAETELRRGELLKKYRLESDRMPVRSDFAKKSSEAPMDTVSNTWQQLTTQPIKLPDPNSAPQPQGEYGFGFNPKTVKDHSAKVPPRKPEPKPKLISVLRLVGAFQENLGNLQNSVDELLGKAVSLEKSYEGASRILTEDDTVMRLLENVKKELIKGKSSVDEAMLGALLNCIKNIERLTTPGFAMEPSTSSSLFVGSKGTSIEDNNPVVSAPVPRKDLSELLATDDDAKKFLCESIAVVLLQTGRRSFTKEGLYSVMAELMKKLEISETSNKIGEVAKKFNSMHLVKMAMKDTTVQQSNPAMDQLNFTSEELVCLLRNFDTLSQEERKCFQYYMQSLQKKRSTISTVELNILDLYLLKTREVEMGQKLNKIMPAAVNQAAAGLEFRPVSFDYSHNNSRNGGMKEDYAQRGGGQGQFSDRNQGGGRGHDNGGYSDQRGGHSDNRGGYSDHRQGGPGSRDYGGQRGGRDEGEGDRRRRDRPRAFEEDRRRRINEDRNPKEAKKARMDNRMPHVSAEALDKQLDNFRDERVKSKGTTNVTQAPRSSDLNPDGSANLSVKYKQPGLNLWVRKGEEEKALFTEKEENGSLTFGCTVCGSQLFGVRNVIVHYEGKKHAKRVEDGGWAIFDPLTDPPKPKKSPENQQAPNLDSEMAAFEREITNVDTSEIVLD